MIGAMTASWGAGQSGVSGLRSDGRQCPARRAARLPLSAARPRSRYTQSFRAIIASGQVEPLVLPARSPNLKPPKEVSLTDPQAAWVARKGTDPFFAYDTNYLIDNKAGIIVDAEGTRANRAARLPSPKP